MKIERKNGESRSRRRFRYLRIGRRPGREAEEEYDYGVDSPNPVDGLGQEIE